MKIIPLFYVNLLLKLALSQSILITVFTSWMQCLWDGVPCCQHIPASVSGISTSLVAVWWEKMLPLRPWCSVSSRPLFLVSFRTPCGRRCFSHISHPEQYSIATRDTVVPMSIEVATKYPLSHDDRIVFEIRLHSIPSALQTSAPRQLKCFESR
jgi:hypothetical protein